MRSTVAQDARARRDKNPGGRPRREESLADVRAAQRTLSRMGNLSSELTGRPLSLRAIACLLDWRALQHPALGEGLALTLPVAPAIGRDEFQQGWREAEKEVRARLVARIDGHISLAERGSPVYGLRFTRIGERWHGFVRRDDNQWADPALPGRLWRSHEHEFKVALPGEPLLPGGCYGARHATPVGGRGEVSLVEASRIDADDGVPLRLARLSLAELRSLRQAVKLRRPWNETVAAFYVQGRDEWRTGERSLRRLLKRADEVEFVHLRTDTGREPLSAEVLARLTARHGTAVGQ